MPPNPSLMLYCLRDFSSEAFWALLRWEWGGWTLFIVTSGNLLMLSSLELTGCWGAGGDVVRRAANESRPHVVSWVHLSILRQVVISTGVEKSWFPACVTVPSWAPISEHPPRTTVTHCTPLLDLRWSQGWGREKWFWFQSLALLSFMQKINSLSVCQQETTVRWNSLHLNPVKWSKLTGTYLKL